MPSPVGHALAGLAVAWMAERLRDPFRPKWLPSSLPVLCIGLAVLPDLDFVYPDIHRTVTHSVTAVVGAAGVTTLLARRLTRAWDWPLALTCGAAYGSHLLLDLLGGDSKSPPGIQLLWPFSSQWFISDWLLFRTTQAKDLLFASNIAINALAVAQEIALLGPLVLALWFARRNSRTAAARRKGIRAGKVPRI